MADDIGNESKPPERFRLPFEFNDTDNLGPWDILLSEDTIDDIRKLKSPLTVHEVMKKLGQISLGKWDKGSQRKESFYVTPVYKVYPPDDDGLRILWQVDHGFSTRNRSLTQLVKIWTITTSQDQIRNISENLAKVHKVYTSDHDHRYTTKQMWKGVILLKNFEDEEGSKSTNDGLYCSEMDNERLLNFHKMIVTNKFIPLSKV